MSSTPFWIYVIHIGAHESDVTRVLGTSVSLLTHHPVDSMTAISQTIFSGAFSWMKSFVFGIGLDNGSAPNRRQAIIWTNTETVHWRICAALGDTS